MTPNVTLTENAKRKKRKLIIAFSVIALAVVGIAAFVLAFSLKDSEPTPTEEELIASFYEKNKSYFVAPDFEATPSDDAV